MRPLLALALLTAGTAATAGTPMPNAVTILQPPVTDYTAGQQIDRSFLPDRVTRPAIPNRDPRQIGGLSYLKQNAHTADDFIRLAQQCHRIVSRPSYCAVPGMRKLADR